MFSKTQLTQIYHFAITLTEVISNATLYTPLDLGALQASDNELNVAFDYPILNAVGQPATTIEGEDATSSVRIAMDGVPLFNIHNWENLPDFIDALIKNLQLDEKLKEKGFQLLAEDFNGETKPIRLLKMPLIYYVFDMDGQGVFATSTTTLRLIAPNGSEIAVPFNKKDFLYKEIKKAVI